MIRMFNKPFKIRMIVFDMYGTLVENGVDDWLVTFEEIIGEQQLNISSRELWQEWRKREVSFRQTRTVMHDPLLSPPFRTYYEAWRDAFASTFQDIGLSGDPEGASVRCTQAQGTRQAFEDARLILPVLSKLCPVGLLSNADHDYLVELVKRHGWSFSTIISSESAQAYKPDPRIFESFSRESGFLPEEILYVGDGPYDDAHGAKQAGMYTALITRDQETPGRTPRPEHEKLNQPDFKIASLIELKNVLDSYL